MLSLIPAACLLVCCLAACTAESSVGDEPEKQPPTEAPDYALVIHGGAGTIHPDRIDDTTRVAIESVLTQALLRGDSILSRGGAAVDAVEAVIHMLEDDVHFNAGRGAVFTYDGTQALDASIMTGHDRQAGAVSGVSNQRHPISLARAVMEHSDHVMLSGRGAEAFANSRGMDSVSANWFYTEGRYQALQRVLERDQQETGSLNAEAADYKYGTVGCVALDQSGNLAAGTSTGGMTAKRYDRIGDSPIIGAGTWADNDGCAVSCTGHGEYFIRWAVASDLSARMIYGGASLKEAADEIIHEVLPKVGASGGLIAMDRQGNIVMPFNTQGMYRGYLRAGEQAVVALFGE